MAFTTGSWAGIGPLRRQGARDTKGASPARPSPRLDSIASYVFLRSPVRPPERPPDLSRKKPAATRWGRFPAECSDEWDMLDT